MGKFGDWMDWIEYAYGCIWKSNHFITLSAFDLINKIYWTFNSPSHSLPKQALSSELRSIMNISFDLFRILKVLKVNFPFRHFQSNDNSTDKG